MPRKKTVDPTTEKFGLMMVCAVRYAIGRETYMPGMIIDYITPLLPYLHQNILEILDRDVTDQRWMGGYGAPCDEKDWMRFLASIHAEEDARGMEHYKTYHSDN